MSSQQESPEQAEEMALMMINAAWQDFETQQGTGKSKVLSAFFGRADVRSDVDPQNDVAVEVHLLIVFSARSPEVLQTAEQDCMRRVCALVQEICHVKDLYPGLLQTASTHVACIKLVHDAAQLSQGGVQAVISFCGLLA